MSNVKMMKKYINRHFTKEEYKMRGTYILKFGYH